MGKIHKLSMHEAQKIAAGEVVERPANILKELIENSIDANSTEIIIFLEEGGKNLVKIIDNGEGMSHEDAKMSIVHHATSKIKTVDDLNALSTFGFRGEALSSICSVSKVEIITKQEEEITGTNLSIENGEIINQELVSCNAGTQIKVYDLFYNIPARRKFLKTTATEYRSCLQIFFAVALAYPNLRFQLYHNDSLAYNCPSVMDITQRTAQLYHDQKLLNTLLPISANNQELSITGVISNHQHIRYDRSQIITLVNNRWIKNSKLSQAILKGYCNVLPPARYPTSVISINIAPELIDVNVHPKKEEVQFLHPIKVEQLIETTVKEALQNSITPKNFNNWQPSYFANSDGLTYSVETKRDRYEFPKNITNNLQNNFSDNLQSDFGAKALNALTSSDTVKPWDSQARFADSIKNSFEPETLQSSNPARDEKYTARGEDNPARGEDNPARGEPVEPFERNYSTQSNITPKETNPHNNFALYNIIGQLNKTYILLQTDEGLLIIDQHAAHEAILFERFSSKFESISTVTLMFPTLLTLSKDRYNIAIEHDEFFKQQGIEFEPFGNNQIKITATPIHTKNINIPELIKEIIEIIDKDYILEKSNNALRNKIELYNRITKRVHATMACKAAVKAGDPLTNLEIEQLLNNFYSLEHRLTCPHGRPTCWLVSTYDIEKKFKRIN